MLCGEETWSICRKAALQYNAAGSTGLLTLRVYPRQFHRDGAHQTSRPASSARPYSVNRLGFTQWVCGHAWPVMKAEYGEASMSIAPAASSGVPMRFSGIIISAAAAATASPPGMPSFTYTLLSLFKKTLTLT